MTDPVKDVEAWLHKDGYQYVLGNYVTTLVSTREFRGSNQPVWVVVCQYIRRTSHQALKDSQFLSAVQRKLRQKAERLMGNVGALPAIFARFEPGHLRFVLARRFTDLEVTVAQTVAKEPV